MKAFHKVLINTLIANVTSSFLWFALTFWIYLETKSVLATAIVGGSYMLFVAFLSLVFGLIVDRNKKKHVMVASTTITLLMYLVAGLLYVTFPTSDLTNWQSIIFWIFGAAILIGGVVENMRNIALSTTVTLLVPKNARDKANGLVGSVQGVAFLVTSVFSGLAIGFLGMGWTLVVAIALTAIALFHLIFFVPLPEKKIAHDPELESKKIDIRGSMKAIHAVPGLLALILFTTFNNLMGGVHMALMDAYGLTLFSVEMWGIVLGVTSSGFIVGGLIISKKGLGKNPLRTLLLVNLWVGVIGMLFAIREFWLIYAVGIFAFMCLVPAAEAAEQTVIQRVVPYERQGRVFGFAQGVESAAAPITAFLIGPIAQYWLIPYMNGDSGKSTFEWLVGSGEARGMALVFVAAGVITIGITLLAFSSRSYRLLSEFYAKT